MTDLDPERSLGALVAERPARASVLEQFRLDYCCAGQRSLTEACAARGLDPDVVRAALQAVDAVGGVDDAEGTDWRAAGIGELCEHIVAVHHAGLREAFPRIGGLLDTVVRVHGADDARLAHIQRLFDVIRADLEPHLASEEQALFPECIAWEEHGAPIDERVIAEHEREHAGLGDELAVLRALCRNYDRETARCNTHRALLDALEAFERDLHRHVHEENNILLLRVRQPRAAQPPARPATEPAEQLLPCCEGWIAEQTHRWARRAG